MGVLDNEIQIQKAVKESEDRKLLSAYKSMLRQILESKGLVPQLSSQIADKLTLEELKYLLKALTLKDDKATEIAGRVALSRLLG